MFIPEEYEPVQSNNVERTRYSEDTTKFPRHFDISLSDLKTLEIVGRGVSGTVFKILHTPTNRILALKEIVLEMSEKVRKQVMLELKTLAESFSPYVVTCYDAFYSHGKISIILEYMDAGSLLDIMKMEGSFNEIILGKIAYMVLKGLCYLHKERHLIHRDIKPSNLLVNLKGEVKISDFGVSSEHKSTLSVANSFVGTLVYMSPERVNGLSYSYASDIWALGLSLVELALGKFPFGLSNSFFDVFDCVVTKPSPSLPETIFSSDLCQFIDLCLKKNPDERPSSTQLLEHSFIKKSVSKEFDMAAWVCNIVTKKNKSAY